MNKSIIISLAVLSGFTAMPAMAAVDQSTYRFECPNASGGTPSERLTNYGTFIRGMGEANTTGNKILPIFKGIPGVGVPLSLSGYVHAGTQYNPSTGRITCLYTNIASPAFDVSYIGMNMKNGWVIKSDNSAISIRVLAG